MLHLKQIQFLILIDKIKNKSYFCFKFQVSNLDWISSDEYFYFE